MILNFAAVVHITNKHFPLNLLETSPSFLGNVHFKRPRLCTDWQLGELSSFTGLHPADSRFTVFPNPATRLNWVLLLQFSDWLTLPLKAVMILLPDSQVQCGSSDNCFKSKRQGLRDSQQACDAPLRTLIVHIRQKLLQ